MEAIEKVMGGGLADMVFCDPPYGVATGSGCAGGQPRAADVVLQAASRGMEVEEIEARISVLESAAEHSKR